MTMHFKAVVAGILVAAPWAVAADYFPPPDKDGGWRTTKNDAETRELAGLEPWKLDAAFECVQRSTPNGGLLVVRHGYLAYEKYFGRASRNANPDMASTGKAFTSIACGIMLEEFKDKLPQGLDTKVFTEVYLPEALPLDDPRKAEISLGQLLCMSAGYWGEGQSPTGYVMGKVQKLEPKPGQNIRDLDQSSLKVPLWTAPGAGYSYSSPSPHIASIVLRHVTGMELQDYIGEKLGKPQGWGPWGYCLQRGDFKMPHANGAGSTALHATDALRFGYCLLKDGMWESQRLVPSAYIQQCRSFLPYNPHTPFSLQFDHNADGHIAGAPKDAFSKSGSGGFCIYIVPSLDLVIYKLGGKDNQYDPTLTGLPQPEQSHERDGWEPRPSDAFYDGPVNLNRVLEMVCAATR